MDGICRLSFVHRFTLTHEKRTFRMCSRPSRQKRCTTRYHTLVCSIMVGEASPEDDSRQAAGASPKTFVASPGTKKIIRGSIFVPLHQHETPVGNLCCLYLGACDSSSVTAQSGVVQKLLHRSRLLQPLAFHVTAGLGAPGLLKLCKDHLYAEACGSQGIRFSAAMAAASLINPSMDEQQGLVVLGHGLDATTPAPTKIVLNQDQVSQLLDVASQGQSLEAVQQGALECVAYTRCPNEGASPDYLASIIVKKLDVHGQGRVSVEDLQQTLLRLNQLVDASGPHSNVIAEELQAVQTQHRVSVDDACQVILKIFPDLSPKAMYEIVNTGIWMEYKYDFSKDYLGVAGLRPVLAALSLDPTFTTLNLSKNGLNCGAVELLCRELRGHPKLTALDLSHNPIAEKGGRALQRLLATNRRLVQLNLTGTPLMTPHSRTHHTHLGPASCEDGVPILAALQLNRRLAKQETHQLAQQLLEREQEVKTVFYGLAGASNEVALETIVSELSPLVVEQLGFEPSTLDLMLSCAAAACQGPALVADEDLTPLHSATYCTWPQLRALLEQSLHSCRDHGVRRVCLAIRHHLASVKRSFYAQSAALQAQMGTSVDECGFPCVLLTDLAQVLEELALEQCWAILPGDCKRVLQPPLFCATTPAHLAGVPGPSGMQDGQVLLSWPCFIGHVLAELV